MLLHQDERAGEKAAESAVVQESAIVIEVVPEEHRLRDSSRTGTPPPAKSGPISSASPSVDEDCLTITEVTDLSTIDEITVADEEEFDEHSCRTTATMVSSTGTTSTTATTGSRPAVVVVGSDPTGTGQTRTDRGCPKNPCLITDYLRIASQHCQVILMHSLRAEHTNKYFLYCLILLCSIFKLFVYYCIFALKFTSLI